MKVKAYPINKGQDSQFFALVTTDQGKGNNFVLNSAPNNWKTKHGAERWAEKRGFTVVGQKQAKKAPLKKPKGSTKKKKL